MKDQIVLITGASRGIGAATALQAAGEGFAVCINYLKNSTAAQDIAKKITEKGGTAYLFQADVSLESAVERMFHFIDSLDGTLYGLVNNAGILEHQMRVEDMKGERLQRIFNNNVLSYFLCCREAIRRMSTKYGGKGGSIVNVSSVAAKTGSPFEYVDYAASKGAVDSLTIGLGKEVAEDGIRVNGVRPGFIYTDIHASGGEPGRVDRIKDTVPMKRGGQPEEVAEAIVWLLSDKSSFVNASFIDVAGGR